MRYYEIALSDPDTGKSLVPAGDGFQKGATGPTFSSLYKDPMTGRIQPDPGALQIEFDIPVSHLAQPQGNFRIKIHGVGVQMLGQAANLAGMNFSMKGGMSAGLPLANPAQAGLLVQGVVLQAWGNWVGTDQTLDLLISPGIKRQIIDNMPIPFFWAAGSSLRDAIDAALAQAFPGFNRDIQIDPRLILANDEAGYYAAPSQWASYLLELTQSLGSKYLGFSYPGVRIFVSGTTIHVIDGSQTAKPTPLQFQDLIGQPTWISGTQITFQTVLRADLSIGSRVVFPSGIVAPFALLSPQAGGAISTPSVPLPAKNKSIFQGPFEIQELHHFGDFRQPSGDAWVTSFVATPPPAGSSS